MYYTSTVNISDGMLSYRHNRITSARQTLLFIHGLGDSGFVFREAFVEAGLRDFNIIVPDLPGYGKSKLKTDLEEEYKFEKQISRLYELLDHLEVNKFFLIGHSMGGDIGTLMCTRYSPERVQAFVNIEGDLTWDDRFITNEAVRIHRAKKHDFEKWVHQELLDFLFAGKRARFMLAKERYQKSLIHCSSNAFWANVKEIRRLNRNLKGQIYARAARDFAEIQIPKVFFWGRKSIDPGSLTWKYLKTKPFPLRQFDSFHWIMLDQRRKFYDSLVEFLLRHRKGQALLA